MSHSNDFNEKQKLRQREKEIQKKLKEEQRRMKKEATYQRFLEKKRKKKEERIKRREEKYKQKLLANRLAYQDMKNDPERYKKYLDYQYAYQNKRRAQKQKEQQKVLQESLKGKTYKEFNGYYVTTEGEIYNKKGMKLKGYLNRLGYVQYNIIGKSQMAHRIVWEAFMGEIPNGYEIDHINTIRDDNRISNLRLMTHSQNCNNPESIKNYSRGNTTGHCISIIQVYPDGTEKEWISAAEAGRNGYNKQCIYQCLNGRIHTSGGCKWYYKKDFEKKLSKK